MKNTFECIYLLLIYGSYCIEHTAYGMYVVSRFIIVIVIVTIVMFAQNVILISSTRRRRNSEKRNVCRYYVNWMSKDVFCYVTTRVVN